MITSLTIKVLNLYKKNQLKKKKLQTRGLLLCKKKQVQLMALHRKLRKLYLLPHRTALIFLKHWRLFKQVKRRVPSKVPRTVFFKFELSTRWLLRQPYSVAKNPQLRMVDIRRYKAYQRIFAYGYMVAGARSFFMHRDINQGKYSNSRVLIKYNHIINDISKFKTWNLKGFCMRPIYMKRLMGLYFGEAYRSSHKNISKVSQVKSKKIRIFFNLFQYSLLSVVYQAFRLLGVVRLLHYVKSGYFYKNGVSVKEPFSRCFPGDVIQLNLFSLFIEPWGLDKTKVLVSYDEFLKIKKRTSWYIVRAAHLTLLLSYFRNFLVKRPFRKKRYSKIIYNTFFSIKRQEFFKLLSILMEFPFQLHSIYKGSRQFSGGLPASEWTVKASVNQVTISDNLADLIVFLIKYHKRALVEVNSLSELIQAYNSLKAYLFGFFWVSLTANPGEEKQNYLLIESKADNLLRTGLPKMTRIDKAAASIPKPTKLRRKRGSHPPKAMSLRNLKLYKARIFQKWRDYLSRTGPYIPQQPTEALPLALWTTYTLDRFFKLKRWVITKSRSKTKKRSSISTSASEGELILRQNWVQKAADKAQVSKAAKKQRNLLGHRETNKLLQISQLHKVVRQKTVSITTSQSVAKSQKSWWRWHNRLTKESLLVDEDTAALSLISCHVQIKGRRSFLNRDGIRFLISFVN